MSLGLEAQLPTCIRVQLRMDMGQSQTVELLFFLFVSPVLPLLCRFMGDQQEAAYGMGDSSFLQRLTMQAHPAEKSRFFYMTAISVADNHADCGFSSPSGTAVS